MHKCSVLFRTPYFFNNVIPVKHLKLNKHFYIFQHVDELYNIYMKNMYTGGPRCTTRFHFNDSDVTRFLVYIETHKSLTYSNTVVKS